VEIDPTVDKVNSYTSPTVVDPEGDEVSIELSLNSTDEATMTFWSSNGAFGFDVFNTATEGEYALDITVADSKSATSSYYMIIVVTVNKPNQAPYFSENMPITQEINIVLDDPSTTLPFVFTSSPAVDPEGTPV